MTATDERRKTLDRLTLLSVAGAHKLWSEMGSADFDASFATVGPGLLALLAAVKSKAVRGAESYVDGSCEEEGINPSSLASLVAGAFVSRSATGRDLKEVIYSPVIATRAALAQKVPMDEALQIGQSRLDRIITTDLHDTSRAAEFAAMKVRPAISGWTRSLESSHPCSRCIVLVGRVYKFSDGFLRHPRCACSTRAVSENTSVDGRDVFDGMSREDQDRTFGKDAAEAVRQGDQPLSRVVNFKREGSGMDFNTPRIKPAEKRRAKRSRQRSPGQTFTADAIVRDIPGDEGLKVLKEQGFIS